MTQCGLCARRGPFGPTGVCLGCETAIWGDAPRIIEVVARRGHPGAWSGSRVRLGECEYRLAGGGREAHLRDESKDGHGPARGTALVRLVLAALKEA